MAMEKARWAESALAQCEERGEAANARALLETSLAKYVEAFVTAKLTRDDRAIHPDILAADYERVGQLIDEGADVDAKAAGWAPIHLAVYHDDPRLLALLIARGADINLPATRRSYTPLIYAAIAGNLNATEQLLNARADPRSTCTDKYRTALDYALKYRQDLLDRLYGFGGHDPVLGAMKNMHARPARIVDLLEGRTELLRRWTRLRAHGRLVGQLVIGLKRLSAGAAARRQVIESHLSEAPSEFDIRERRRYQPRLIEYSPASSYRK